MILATAVILLIFGYILCGLMMLSAMTLRDDAYRKRSEAIYLKNVLLSRRPGQLLVRKRRVK